MLCSHPKVKPDGIVEDNSPTNSQLLITDLPDSILLYIFQYLPFTSVCRISRVCVRLNQVSSDELLWRSVFLRHYKLPFSTSLPERAVSWRSEFKRLFYHTPALLAQELKEHKDEVLHASFSHDGTMFATCSKDGFFMIWSTQTFPVSLLFKMDMRGRFGWHFTQFSQFNETDTCLLVSGVYKGRFTTSGEIAIFDLQNGFEMQSHVTNKPYDVLGAWYDNEHLLSGTVYPTGGLGSVSAIWISKASQEVESEVELVSMVLYRFHNKNSSTVRLINVADIERPSVEQEGIDDSEDTGADVLCDCGQVCGNSAKPSLLDKLLRKEISEEEFDIENEDKDENENEEEGEKMACEIDNSLENKELPLGEEKTGLDCLKIAGETVDMKVEYDGNCLYGMDECSVDMLDSSARISSDDNPQDACAGMSAGCSKNSSSFTNSCHISASGDASIQNCTAETPKSEICNFSQPIFSSHSSAHSSYHPKDQVFQPNHVMPSKNLSVQEASQFGVKIKNELDSSHTDASGLCEGLEHLQRAEVRKKLPDQCKNSCAYLKPGSSLQADSNTFTGNSNVNFNSRDMDFQLIHMDLERVCGIDGVDGASNSSVALERLPDSNISENSNASDNEWEPLSPPNSADTNSNSQMDGEEMVQDQKSSKHKVSATASKSSQCSASTSSFVEFHKPCLKSRATPKGNQCWDGTRKPKTFQTSSSNSHHVQHHQRSCRHPPEKLLIYTWGTETYTPHKIGIKRMKWTDFNKGEVTARRESMLPSVMENMQNGAEPLRQDSPDHSFEMHGHIVGLRVAPDQRYLYVNCRPWPENYIISNPQESPPLAQEIEISKIDLRTFEIVGPVLRSHKAYTHGDDCFFLCLDVSENFVVSGAEDKQGYLWDRHYNIPLYRFPHTNVVSCVALNPTDPEMLVTVSDDFSIKVWTSRHLTSQHKANGTIEPSHTESECS